MIETYVVLGAASIAGSLVASSVSRLMMATMKVGKHNNHKTKINHDIPDEEVEVDGLDEE